MKFSTVELFYNSGEWHVRFTNLSGDRTDEGSGPNNLGFFHYPSQMGNEKAFELLRAHLIDKNEKEIASLTERLVKLKALKMSNREHRNE